MSNNNQKRVVVITGSSRGIGKAIAKEFAKNNYSVLLNARDEKELIETVQEINQLRQADGETTMKQADNLIELASAIVETLIGEKAKD